MKGEKTRGRETVKGEKRRGRGGGVYADGKRKEESGRMSGRLVGSAHTLLA